MDSMIQKDKLTVNGNEQQTPREAEIKLTDAKERFSNRWKHHSCSSIFQI